MKNIYTLLLLLTCSLSPALYAQTTVVIPASQDNTIYSESPGNSNGAGENFTVGTIANPDYRRGLIRFDLSALPAGATITGVSLQLYINRSNGGATDISLYRLNQAWGEGASLPVGDIDGTGIPAQAGDVTWTCSFADGAGGCTTAWGTAGGVFEATASATTSVIGVGYYLWSSTQAVTDVQGWVNNAALNFGWIMRSPEVIERAAKRFASRTNAVVANRPALSVTYTTVVPVSLVYFKASAQKYGSLLRWQTAQETDNDFFEVEHSLDGVHFNSIGKLQGAGNSSQLLNYNFTHQTAVAGKHFYRLAQTDFTKRKTYSKIEVLSLNKNNNTTLIVSPNPVTDGLLLPGLDINAGLRYSIINYNGQKIAEAALINRQIILPKNITSGVYQLRITGSNGVTQSAGFIK